MIKVEKITDKTDKHSIDEYIYAVSFNGTKKQFNTYMQIVGSITEKKYDFTRNVWRFREHQYLILQDLIDKATPKKQRSVSIVSVDNKAVSNYENIGDDMKLAPYMYQRETMKFGIDNLTTLLVLPCGSGKTPIGIGLYLEAKKNNIINTPGMIVVKASLKTQWSKEIQKFSDLKCNIIQTSKDITSSTRAKIKRRKDRIAKLLKKPGNERDIQALEVEIVALTDEANNLFYSQFTNVDLLVLNYETLNDSFVRSEIHSMRLQFIFADEIHYIKSHVTNRAKSLCEFADVKVKAGATATPVQRDPRDLYGIFKFINPTVFPSEQNFQRLFLKYAGRGRVVGSKNEKELNKKISPYMIVKTKEEVSKQLPDLVVMQRYCDLEPEQLEMTESIKEEIEELQLKEESLRAQMTEKEAEHNPEIKKIEANILARQTFAQELAISEQLLLLSGSEMAKNYITGSNDNKMDLLIELFEELLGSGEKVCVFSRFATMQDIITERIQREAKRAGSIFKGVKIAYVQGKLNSAQRYVEVYDKFRDKDEYKILLMSDAGAEGINLSKCRYIIEMEPAESYAIQTQRHGRVERADSVHDTVFVYQLIANESWDEIGVRIVIKKEKYDSSLIKGEEVY